MWITIAGYKTLISLFGWNQLNVSVCFSFCAFHFTLPSPRRTLSTRTDLAFPSRFLFFALCVRWRFVVKPQKCTLFPPLGQNKKIKHSVHSPLSKFVNRLNIESETKHFQHCSSNMCAYGYGFRFEIVLLWSWCKSIMGFNRYMQTMTQYVTATAKIERKSWFSKRFFCIIVFCSADSTRRKI